MPREQHVFLAQFAGVTDESELERVLVRPAKFVNAFALAIFWIDAAGPD